MNPTPVPRNVRTAHTRRTARDRQRRPPRQSAPGCGCLVNLVAALLLVGAVVALLPLGVMAFEVAHDGRIYPGVSVGGVDVGGCKPEEARARVQKVYAGYAAEPLLLQYQDDSWPVTPAELGLRVDANPAIAAAFAVGRTPDLSASLQDQAQALTQGYAFDPHITLDAGVLTSALNEFAEQIDQPGGDAAIQMQGLQVTLKAGQSSRRLDLVRLADDLLAACQARSHGPITLVIDESAAALTPDQLAPAITSAGHILARPIVLTFPAPLPSDSGPAAVFTHTWALDQAALAEALWFPLERDATGQVMASARLHEEPLRNWVQGIADEVNQPVRNARLDLNPVRMTLSPIVTSQEGRTVDITATVTAIQLAALTDGERVVPLVVDITPPAVDMRDPAALGIRELVSTGQTQFQGSSAERVHNIVITAQKLHGVVVPPNGVFSFVEYLGDATEADGYQESYVIYGDRTVMDIGGGVCQVSTTCYRAAWWAGCPILVRTPHAFRIGWYEPPLGMDATVFAPSVDLQFQNNTPACLLIQTEVDEVNSTITFRFYGTKPDWTVDMDGPYTSSVLPAPAPVYENDPTLPRGVTKQVGSAHDGVDVTIYRVVTQNGQVIERERFFTRFQPWAARYLVGTK